MSTVVVLAKTPEPGLVKTRLCPPCTPEQAAAVADACLRDTIAAVDASGAAGRVLVLDGMPGPWLPSGWRVVPQYGDDLNTRLDAAFHAVDPPSVLVAMDTPQLRAGDLDRALAALREPGCDAVLGPALDGGYWAIGFARRTQDAFRGVPMSETFTCAAQHARLLSLGLGVRFLAAMRDIDTYDDAIAVAQAAPGTRVARLVASLVPTGAS
jgi:hypothetical protein